MQEEMLSVISYPNNATENHYYFTQGCLLSPIESKPCHGGHSSRRTGSGGRRKVDRQHRRRKEKNITACREAGEGWDYRRGGHSKVNETNGITRRRWRNAVRDPMMGVVEVVALLGGMPVESAPPLAENDCMSTLECHL